MRNGTSILLWVALTFIILTSPAHAQHSLLEFTLLSPPKGVLVPPVDKLKIRSWVRPLHPSLVGKSSAELTLQSAAGSTIPLWTGSDNGYTFQMVGQDPSVPHSNQVTNIKAQLIPVQITFYGSPTVVFDPTKKDICSPNGSPLTLVQHSPIFNKISLPIAPLGAASSAALGTAQFTSLFQRGNFFKYTGPTGANQKYEVTLTLTTLPVVKASTYFSNLPEPRKCDPVGYIDIDTVDYLIIRGIIPTLASSGVGPTTLPIFLLNNVVMFDDAGNCCILGYHQSFISGTSGALQTFVVANYDTSGLFPDASDISPLSHEIAEWMNDPTLLNPTPSWGNVGQVQGGCQDNLEIGDPLTGTLFPIHMPNFTYHVQDLAFKSWFYGDAPSIGVNGWYSLFGTFRSAALPCP